jgi:hypothetical protein
LAYDRAIRENGGTDMSSARGGNGDSGRVRARRSQAKPRKRQRERAEKWRCSGGGDLARGGS